MLYSHARSWSSFSHSSCTFCSVDSRWKKQPHVKNNKTFTRSFLHSPRMGPPPFKESLPHHHSSFSENGKKVVWQPLMCLSRLSPASLHFRSSISASCRLSLRTREQLRHNLVTDRPTWCALSTAFGPRSRSGMGMERTLAPTLVRTNASHNVMRFENSDGLQILEE
jgi:hypothetical protein